MQTSIAPGIPSWFEEKINLATGLAYSGASIGTIVGPFFILYFSDIYGTRGAFIIISGLWLQLVIVGALQRKSPKSPRQTKRKKDKSKVTNKNDNDIVWVSDNSGISTITIVDGHYAGPNVIINEQNTSSQQNGTITSDTPTYRGLLKRPKVIRALIILFSGIAGGIGKDKLSYTLKSDQLLYEANNKCPFQSFEQVNISN